MSDAKTEIVEPVLAEGVDQEPVEPNRRQFSGLMAQFAAVLAILYAGFHMAALNGVSLSDYTGIDLAFLPQFPLETWNFRIMHIAGALVLGFLMFAAHRLNTDEDIRETRTLTLAGYVLLIPVAVAFWTVFQFMLRLNSGELPEMGGLVTWPAFAGTEIYAQELWWFGTPLLIATFGAIVLSWFERRKSGAMAASDIVMALCGILVALYLIPIYSTAARNSVGTSFVPIGVAFAATAGSALILELTRRVAGLALVIIAGVTRTENVKGRRHENDSFESGCAWRDPYRGFRICRGSCR